VQKRRLLVFTDLDGTLLDPVHYDWRAAAPMLAELKRRHIPLILCTSKTRAEVDSLRRKMGHEDPYIAENGGILVVPWKFLGKPHGGRSLAREFVVKLGWSSAEMMRMLAKLAREAKVRVRGLHQMSAAEIAGMTGLTLAQARKARMREASEPFRFVDATPAQMRAFRAAARKRRIQVAEGARFWHLAMGADKGQAMMLLIHLTRIVEGLPVQTIAAGDSSIDLPMLKLADLPILMPRVDGEFDPQLTRAVPGAIRAAGAGPLAWAKSIQSAVARFEQTAVLAPTSLLPAAIADDRRVAARPEVFPLPVQAAQGKPRASRKKAASQ
jgi:mannosyl-3-phosphoglycerate phosphatase